MFHRVGQSFSRYRLNTKFTLSLLVVLVGGILLAYLLLNPILQRRARDEVATRGLVLIETMNAVRFYTSNHVNPLLAEDLQTSETFIPETVPAYSAREVFERFRSDPAYASFLYKEATLNPTNLRDLADDFETDLVNSFIQNPDQHEQNGYRNLFGERVFYIARPLRISSESCLTCHGDPAEAPASLINTYGAEHGFGWQMGDIIAAQVIYVPASDVFGAARESLIVVMGVFVVVFIVAIFLMNLLLRTNVIAPVSQIATVAEKVAAGDVKPDDLDSGGIHRYAGRGDEVGLLSRIFQRMAQEIIKREQQLKAEIQRLRIQIDEKKKDKQVSEIVESDYFVSLKEKARDLRKRE